MFQFNDARRNRLFAFLHREHEGFTGGVKKISQKALPKEMVDGHIPTPSVNGDVVSIQRHEAEQVPVVSGEQSSRKSSKRPRRQSCEQNLGGDQLRIRRAHKRRFQRYITNNLISSSFAEVAKEILTASKQFYEGLVPKSAQPRRMVHVLVPKEDFPRRRCSSNDSP